MTKGGKKLRILDGFLTVPHTLSSKHINRVSLAHWREPFQPFKPGGLPSQDLTDALRTMEQRLNALLEDRSRLGRDLHDGILQSLYAIGLNLEAARRANPSQSRGADGLHHDAIGQINRLISEIRCMIRGLTEGTVQDFDLSDELVALVAAYDQVDTVSITLNLDPEALEVLTKEEEREILQIVREALSNSIRHACATHVTLALRRCGDKIQLAVRDDGTGFSMVEGSTKKGYGLANMETRARKIGGTLRVRSERGLGTDITAEFTLEPMLTPV